MGWSVGDIVTDLRVLPAPYNDYVLIHLLGMVLFGGVGALLVPLMLGRPLVLFYNQIASLSIAQIVAGFIGLSAGLLLAALLAFPLARLPEPFGPVLPFLAAVGFGTLGLGITTLRYREMFEMLSVRLPGSTPEGEPAHTGTARLLLDTSVIIDGRIADVNATGFLMGELVIPQFVLNELQYIADSSDPLRRARGRRGLEVLRRIQRESPRPVHIMREDPGNHLPVDEKLITLARKWNMPIITNDYNLNRVASLQGVTVLNVNELANAVKTAVLPGETLTVQILQPGREIGQGVGYLDDGTMVVVTDGQAFLEQTIEVSVTKVLQTAAGRMIFAKPAVSQPAAVGREHY